MARVKETTYPSTRSRSRLSTKTTPIRRLTRANRRARLSLSPSEPRSPSRPEPTPPAEPQYKHLVLDPESGVNLHVGADQGTRYSILASSFVHQDSTADSHINIRRDLISPRYGNARILSIAVIVPDPNSTTGTNMKMVFGHSAEAYVEQQLRNVTIIRFFKLARVDNSVSGVAASADMLQRIHQSQEDALNSLGPTRRVNVYSEYDNKLSVCQVSSVQEVEILFQMYLLDQVRLHLRRSQAFSNVEIEGVMQRARVGLGMPTVWSDKILDDARDDLARKAAYPTDTKIFAESKAATTFRLMSHFQRLEGEARLTGEGSDKVNALRQEYLKKIIIGGDIGAATLLLTSMEVIQTNPMRLGEVVAGSGSLFGSQRLNDFLVGLFVKANDAYIERAVRHEGVSQSDLLEAVSEGFEGIKWLLDQRLESPSEEAFTIKFSCPRKGDTRACKGKGVWYDQVEVPRALIVSALQEWSSGIVKNIRQHYKKTIKMVPDVGTIEIVLSGGGSHSKHLVQAVEEEFASDRVRVVQSEPQNDSSVAQGLLVMLMDPNLGNDKFARASYGTKLHVPYDEDLHNPIESTAEEAPAFLEPGCKEIPDRIAWDIKKGQNLMAADSFISGYIDYEDDFSDIELYQHVFSSKHDVVSQKTDFYGAEEELKNETVEYLGKMAIKIGPYRKFGLKMIHYGGKRFVRVEYRVEIVRDGIVWMIRFIVPKGGYFPENHGRNYDGDGFKVEEFFLKDIAPHEVRADDKDVDMPDIEVEDGGEVTAENELSGEALMGLDGEDDAFFREVDDGDDDVLVWAPRPR